MYFVLEELNKGFIFRRRWVYEVLGSPVNTIIVSMIFHNLSHEG